MDGGGKTGPGGRRRPVGEPPSQRVRDRYRPCRQVRSPCRSPYTPRGMDTKFERRYARIERLGGGQSGEVWRAHDKYLGCDVALKLIEDPRDAAEVILEATR